MNMKLLVAACCALVACTLAQDNIDPVNQFNLAGVPVVEVTSLGGNAELKCDDVVEGFNHTYPAGATANRWLLPREDNGDIPMIFPGATSENVQVSGDGQVLTVTGVTRANLGTYHCMMEEGGEFYMVRVGLNSRGPYFIDEWQEWYKEDFIQGMMGFFFSLAAISSTAVVWGMFSGKEEEEEEGRGDAEKGVSTVAGGLQEKVALEEKMAAVSGVENKAYEVTDQANTAL